MGVAAHEAGHAVQYSKGYVPIKAVSYTHLDVYKRQGGKSTYKLFALFKKEVVPWLIHCISVSIAFGHILNLSPPPSAE